QDRRSRRAGLPVPRGQRAQGRTHLPRDREADQGRLLPLRFEQRPAAARPAERRRGLRRWRPACSPGLWPTGGRGRLAAHASDVEGVAGGAGDALARLRRRRPWPLLLRAPGASNGSIEVPLAYLALGLLIMVALVYLSRWFTNADAAAIARVLRWSGVG